MSTIYALFQDSQHAGEAVGDLKAKGFTDDISVVARDHKDGDVETHEVKQDTSDGATGGAVVGAALGALGTILAGITSIALPVLGTVLVAGPIAAALAGAAAGAAAGSLVGALVDMGIPEERAKVYEDRIQRGEVFVAVSTDDDRESEAKAILEQHQAQEIYEG